MSGFVGKSIHSLDDKGRLVIPSKFAKKLAADTSSLYVMKTPEGALDLYEPKAWEEKEKAVAKLDDLKSEERLLKTLLYQSLEEAELSRTAVKDSITHRIVITKDLQEHLGVSKEANEVVLVGGGNKFSIWKPEKLQRAVSENQEMLETLTSRHLQ